MYLPFVATIIVVGLCAVLVAWYYNRAFQSVRYEYLGSARSGMSGQADDIYLALVRPLRTKRLAALCVATAAICLAIVLIGLHTA